MRLHVFQHVESEGPGTIEAWARARGHTLTVTGFYRDDALPNISDIDALIVLGGPMSVQDEEEFSWLRREKDFLRTYLSNSSKPLLGICLGSQLIAEALGAKVYANPFKEIGWFPVSVHGSDSSLLGRSSEIMTFHWHGDTFDVPAGARVLARSEATPHQVYLLKDRILGLQCHFEIDEQLVEAMIAEGGRELLEKSPFIQSAEKLRAGLGLYGERVKQSLFEILDRFFG